MGAFPHVLTQAATSSHTRARRLVQRTIQLLHPVLHELDVTDRRTTQGNRRSTKRRLDVASALPTEARSHGLGTQRGRDAHGAHRFCPTKRLDPLVAEGRRGQRGEKKATVVRSGSVRQTTPHTPPSTGRGAESHPRPPNPMCPLGPSSTRTHTHTHTHTPAGAQHQTSRERVGLSTHTHTKIACVSYCNKNTPQDPKDTRQSKRQASMPKYERDCQRQRRR